MMAGKRGRGRQGRTREFKLMHAKKQAMSGRTLEVLVPLQWKTCITTRNEGQRRAHGCMKSYRARMLDVTLTEPSFLPQPESSSMPTQTPEAKSVVPTNLYKVKGARGARGKRGGHRRGIHTKTVAGGGDMACNSEIRLLAPPTLPRSLDCAAIVLPAVGDVHAVAHPHRLGVRQGDASR